MQTRQLFDQSSGTYTYLLFDPDSREGVLIDPVYEQHDRDLALIRELNISLKANLETHCHADHVTGAWLMKEATGCRMLASAASGIKHLDQQLNDGDVIAFGKNKLLVVSTPGHTNGCISFISDDQSAAFTGDTLLIRGCGRTDFQEGSASSLFHSIRDKLFALPATCTIYPGHDYSGRTASTIGEEIALNPRIGGQANENDFVGYMTNMELPHPRKLEVAVPANLDSGKPSAAHPPEHITWAPVTTTWNGVNKVEPSWVAENLKQISIVDVRSETELIEEPELIPGAIHLPLPELKSRSTELPQDKPVMTVCRSGKRSDLACQILKKAGIDKTANINGGMLKWIEEGLPTEKAL